MEVTNEILTIDEESIYLDNSIEKENLLQIFPTSGSNLEKGEIKFIIETNDQYLLPSESYIYLEGKITKIDGSELVATDNYVTLTNNAPMFLFNRASYSLEGKIIEDIYDPGRASLMKGILSYSSNLSKQNTFGWILDNATSFAYKTDAYTGLQQRILSFYIPLNHIFGFAENYKKVIYGHKHSLSLFRNSDTNSIHSLHIRNNNRLVKFIINGISWFIPEIIPNLQNQNKLLNMRSKNTIFNIPYMSRQLEERDVPISRKFNWKLGTKYEKIKYIIIGFQTGRNDNYNNAARFDHCDLDTIFVELNSKRYPYDCLKCNFRNYNAVQQYNFAKKFKNTYYETEKDCIFIDRINYCGYYPLFVFDVTKQNEKIINSRPDITINASFVTNIPNDTKCYCLIICDSLINTDGNKKIEIIN
jgi:hypothetical protein